MYWFAIASLTPAAFILVACFVGGPWALAALISVTLYVFAMDRINRPGLQVRDDDAADKFAGRLCATLAMVHFVLLISGIWALAHLTALSVVQGIALAIALGLFMGQVSNSNAHELIHASARRLRWLGVLVYVSLLFGHHASAHPKVHHVHVATKNDPNSARQGQGFYHFWPRAWLGSFREGLRAEKLARARAQVPPHMMSHPFIAYVGGAIAALTLAWFLAGVSGVIVYLSIAIYAQAQLLLADYVQHYGLRRAHLANGRTEPAGPLHSWNAPQWYSSAMMLNAPLHSDHHAHPRRRFPALRIDPDTMPVLPFSLPVMAAIALAPVLWRRIMDPRVNRWRTVQGSGGATPGDLPLSPHASDLDDSPDFDGPAGVGPDDPVG